MKNDDATSDDQIECVWIDNQQLSHEKMVELLKVFGDLLPDPMSERVDLDAYADKWLKNADILLAYEKDKIVGMRVLYANDLKTRHAHGLLLSILPSHQGLGIARKMYTETFLLAKQRGMTQIYHYVHYENQRMIKLNESLGYKVVGFRSPKIEMCLELS